MSSTKKEERPIKSAIVPLLVGTMIIASYSILVNLLVLKGK